MGRYFIVVRNSARQECSLGVELLPASKHVRPGRHLLADVQVAKLSFGAPGAQKGCQSASRV
jgi:hypothetical protein